MGFLATTILEGQMSFKSTVSSIWYNIQHTLFPILKEEIDLSDKYKDLVSALEMIRIEQFISSHVQKEGHQKIEFSSQELL